MAIGDAATAAGIPLIASTADVREGYNHHNETRDIIAQRTAEVTPITKGGTGATSASEARSALGITPLLDAKLTRTNSQYNADFASRDTQIARKLDKSTGGTVEGTLGVSGAFYVGTRPPASFSYVVAYFNGDNQLCSGASSNRWKQDIVRGPALPNLFAVPLAEFAMRQDADKTRRFGYIAEDLAKSPEMERFVVYDDKGLPFSYDMMALLLAQTAQLHQENTALRDRLDALEARLDRLEPADGPA